MFRKNKGQGNFHIADDGRVLTNDFCLTISDTYGHESYRTVEYRDYARMEEGVMIPLLDDHLNKLFAGEVDDANGDVLDDIIYGAVREALPDLNRQRYDHGDMIRRFDVRFTANESNFICFLEQRNKERERIQHALDKVDALIDQYGEG